MHESEADRARLQAVLDASSAQAGEFLRSSLKMPDCSLTAAQLIRYLVGNQVVALATVTAKGEPRVAPIGSLFYRSEFYIPTVATAARTRHLLQRPAVSLTHAVGIDLAIIVHGRAAILPSDHPDFEQLETLHRESNGQSVMEWGEGVYLRVEAERFYTFARYPEQFPA